MPRSFDSSDKKARELKAEAERLREKAEEKIAEANKLQLKALNAKADKLRDEAGKLNAKADKLFKEVELIAYPTPQLPSLPSSGGQEIRTFDVPPVYASKQSGFFHRKSCYWCGKIHAENLVGFRSREAALECGYKPCFECRP